VVAQIVAERNPDAGAAEYLVPVHMKRFFEQMHDAFCNIHSGMRLAQIFKQHGELIAAKTRQGVARSHALLQTTGDGDQQLIADEMPQAVIDQFEPVEIEDENGIDGGGAASCARDHMPQTIHEARAVGESGQAIVEGIVPQTLFRQFAIGYIGLRADICVAFPLTSQTAMPRQRIQR
jgi:hypothetical protein